MSDKILDRIRDEYDSYPRGSQAVASVILDQPAQVLSMSIVELAQLADVSDPTVLRFARKLGFSGYKDFKRALAEEINPVVGTAEGIVVGSDGFLSRIVNNYVVDLARILSEVNEDMFARAVEAISQADQVEFWGQCTSSALAMDAYDKFFHAGIACVSSTEPDQQRLYRREYGKGDVIVAISHLGHNEEIARSLVQATALGATTISISTAGSLVANSSAISITTEPMEETLFSEMNMKAAHVFIVDAMATAVIIEKNGGDFKDTFSNPLLKQVA